MQLLHGTMVAQQKVPQLRISRLSHFATIFFGYLYIYIYTGFLKVYVSYVSQSNFCQLFFCEKNPIIGRYGLQPSQVGWGSCERKTGSFTSPRSCCKKKRNRNKWEKQTSIDTNTESQSRHSHCVLAGFYLR